MASHLVWYVVSHSAGGKTARQQLTGVARASVVYSQVALPRYQRSGSWIFLHLRFESPFPDCLDESPVVALVLVAVLDGKLADRVVEEGT